MLHSNATPTNNPHECIKFLKIFNYNLKNAEKEQKAYLLTRKNDADFSAIYEMHLTNESNLKKNRESEINKLSRLKSSINAFKHESKIARPSEDVVKHLKQIMEDIDSNISAQKEETLNGLESLYDQEKILNKELEIYANKITSWSMHNNSSKIYDADDSTLPSGGAAKAKKINLSNSDLLKEVIDFDKFLLNNGGHNGGWDQIDHGVFLKIRNKHKGNETFVDELSEMIATRTRDEIEAHEEWYKKYTSLNELKKKAIQEWKEQKRAKKGETVNLIDEELRLNQEIDKELKERFEKRRQQEKMELQKKLNEWKLEKEIQKASEREKQKSEEEKLKQQEYLKFKKQEELRQKISEYKQQKQELDEFIEMEQYLYKKAEEQVKSARSKAEIDNFQQRDMARLIEKQNREKEKKLLQEQKKQKLEKLRERVQVDSDPNRLYQMTSSWKRRVNTPRSESCGPIPTNLVQHLAVPQWRQGV